jgi:hypothetical protein
MPSYGISLSIRFEQPTANRATNGALRPQGLQAIMAQSVPVSVCLPMSASQEVLLNRMTSPPNSTDPTIIQAFAKIPALLEQNPGLIDRARFLECDCLLGPIEQPFHAAIRAGKIVDLTPAPVLMRSWRFAYRATPAAWAEYWQPMPRPGWHDLFALTKRGEAVLEGDLHPFMANLQYFKDVLALPRQYFAAVPA